MIKTLTLDGLTSVTIKQSAYDMARFCWVNNRSDSDIFMSCTDPHCTENADGVKHIPAGEHGMLDTESYETLYIKGSGMVNIETSPFAVCPFGEGKKGGGTSLSGSASYTISNAVDYPLMGLNLYGKSTQDGIPTPDTPVDIVSVGDSGSVDITVNNGDKSVAASITSALPLCGVPVSEGGNYTDTNGQQWVCDELIYNADGTGKIIKRIAKYIFTGAESNGGWYLTSTNDSSKKRFLFIFFSSGASLVPLHDKGIYTISDPSRIICDRYQAISNLDTYNCVSGIAVGHSTDNGQITIYDDNCSAMTIDEWKSRLAENPITVVYQLNTPQEIPLTAADVSALMQLKTYSGVTNITNSNSAEMDVKYCTDKALSKYVMPVITNMQAQIDELKSAVLSLGGNV